MSFNPRSLFSVEDFSQDEWNIVFNKAKSRAFSHSGHHYPKASVGLIFFEPSSRTRWSFARAALDLDLRMYETVVDQSSSLSKGETVQDSLELFFNLGYDVVIGRTPLTEHLRPLIDKYQVNYVNAGFGDQYHPTQAFLDVFTWQEETSFAQPRVLLIGDVKHSRVVRSHLRFSKIRGYEVGVLAPEGYSLDPSEIDQWNVKSFSSRKEALEWAEVVYLLRTQKERHSGEQKKVEIFPPFSLAELRQDQFLMHPGPFIRGVDFEEEVLQDQRCLIFKQKRNGVLCRSALLDYIFSVS